jgi:periplasmic divalent cation tolerance protein
MGSERPVAVVLTTAPSADVAESLASRLVDEGLAACVNVIPGVTSIFRWEGATQREAEILLVVKTTADRVSALRDRIVGLHPYEVPEVVALPVSDGHAAYLAWVRAETAHGGSDGS